MRSKQARRQGNAKHIKRNKGPPKDCPLPNPANFKNLKKIPRDMIDKEWLKTHPEFDSPQFWDPPAFDREASTSHAGSSEPGEPSLTLENAEGDGIPIDPALLAEDEAMRRENAAWDGDNEEE